jgi:Tfp pilus assembly protein PilF
MLGCDFTSLFLDDFVGREEELGYLGEVLLREEKNAVICGEEGIGKSSLAAKFIAERGEEFRGILTIILHPLMTLEEILREFNFMLLEVGVEGFAPIFASPLRVEEKLERLSRFLDEKRLLVVIDDFSHFKRERLEKILDLIKRVEKTKFILTGNEDDVVKEAVHIHLKGLSRESAYILMDRVGELSASQRKKIYHMSRGSPFYIRLLSNRSMLHGDISGREKTLEDIYMSLSHGEQSLLQKLVMIEGWIHADIVEAASKKTIDKLVRYGLIMGGGCYFVHNIVKEYVRAHIKNQREILSEIAADYESLVDKYSDLWDHLRAREYYYQAREYSEAGRIVQSAFEALLERGHVELASRLLLESVNTLDGEEKLLAIGNLATVYQRLGEEEKALSMYGELMDYFERKNDKRKISGLLNNMGAIHFRRGEYKKAREMFEKSLQICKNIGDKKGTCISLHNLASTLQELKKYELAKEKYEECVHISSELGDKMGFAQSLYQLGTVLEKLGSYEEALEKYSISAAAFDNLRSPTANVVRESIKRVKRMLD